ncbi:hypothetical protein VTK56DRAFT_10224 [Thermocarpiscus australiensis]
MEAWGALTVGGTPTYCARLGCHAGCNRTLGLSVQNAPHHVRHLLTQSIGQARRIPPQEARGTNSYTCTETIPCVRVAGPSALRDRVLYINEWYGRESGASSSLVPSFRTHLQCQSPPFATMRSANAQPVSCTPQAPRFLGAFLPLCRRDCVAFPHLAKDHIHMDGKMP